MPNLIDNSLLLVLPVPFAKLDGQWCVEAQAFNGIKLWADHFSKVAVAALTLPDFMVEQDRSIVWRPVDELPCRDRVEIHPLPYAYQVTQFLRTYRATRKELASLIQENHYLSFAIGGLIGDWASVACLEAHRQGHKFSIWTDAVTHQHIRRGMFEGKLRRRFKAAVTWRPTRWLEHYIVRRCALGLFHGRETYDAYAPYCSAPHVVHNIHLKAEDAISDEALIQKKNTAKNSALHICYVGRAIEIKGPTDWLHAIHRLHKEGIPLEATWLGDGAELEPMRKLVDELGLESVVTLPGFVDDRESILSTLRESHLMQFCHKTPESPRCLIESLMSGCPIIGYENSFAKDLVAENGGGAFVEMNDVAALASVVRKLHEDRERLVGLIDQAAESGKMFNDEQVFHHRSELIKQYLS